MNLCMIRKNDRTPESARTISFDLDPIEHAEGSCIVSFGRTKVLCTCSVETKIPKWLQGTGDGWVTAEYSMLPRSTHTRIRRDKAMSGGRSQEISRLIGRALRSGVDMSKLAEKSFIIDCDVLQADGGTRTAAITGGFVAMARAFEFLKAQGEIAENPLRYQVAALSAGYVNDKLLVDLDYEEDSNCQSDINLVFNSNSELIEVQGTAESKAFSIEELTGLIKGTQVEVEKIFKLQQEAIVSKA